MATLEDTVRQVIEDLMTNNELFTALDISNNVKKILPNARHREVRDVVRAMFASDIEPKGYSRSPITVTLNDGTTAEALLYHPLSDTWDLDHKYDQQKRQQTSANPVAVAAAAVAAVAVVNPAAVAAVNASATPPSTTNAISDTAKATVTISATTAVPMPTARDLWKQLFATQPSLFPTK